MIYRLEKRWFVVTRRTAPSRFMPSLLVWKFCADTWYFVNKKTVADGFPQSRKPPKQKDMHTKKVPGPLWSEDFFSGIVELEGVEPSSKQGNHTLSTRLSRPSVFVRKQDPSHPFTPYPLRFHRPCKAADDYLRFSCTTFPECFGATVSEWCLVSAPGAEIKVIYYTSITQRERSCFRQINSW